MNMANIELPLTITRQNTVNTSLYRLFIEWEHYTVRHKTIVFEILLSPEQIIALIVTPVISPPS
jgi:hypothetical protein